MGWWPYYFAVRLVLKMEGGDPHKFGWCRLEQAPPSRPRWLLSIWVGLSFYLGRSLRMGETLKTGGFLRCSLRKILSDKTHFGFNHKSYKSAGASTFCPCPKRHTWYKSGTLPLGAGSRDCEALEYGLTSDHSPKPANQTGVNARKRCQMQHC